MTIMIVLFTVFVMGGLTEYVLNLFRIRLNIDEDEYYDYQQKQKQKQKRKQ